MIDRRRSKWTPMLAVAMIPLVVGYRHSRGERTFRRIQSLDEIAPNVFAPTPSKVVPEKKVGPQKLGPNPLGDSLDALEAELENSTDVLDSPALSPTVESVESSPVSSPSSSGTGGNIYSLPTIPTVSIVQSLENLRSSSSGKAGKASKSKSLKGCKKATKSKVSKAPHPSKAPSPSQAPNPSKAPSSGKGKGGSSKHAHHLRPECEDDGSGSLEYSTDHCNSIQTASASTDGPSATFQIDFVLIIRGDVASVLSSLQSFFQQVIAPFMAGCNSEGLVPGTISNVVFTVTEDTTESCSSNIPGTTCNNVDVVTTVYFNDDTSSVSADDVLDLVTKFCGAIKDLEGIEDTLDPCTTIAITPIPTGDGVSAVQGDQFQPTTRISSAAVVGVALAALALLLVILFAARSKQRERYIEKHHSLDEEFDDETYLKDDYEKSSFKSDMERSSLGNISPERSPLAVGGARPSIAGQGRSASYFSPSTSSRPSPERTQSFPDMRRTHIIGEADSMISSWDNYTPNRPMSAPPVIKSFHNLRVDQDGLVDVHKCSSATCEVCEANRQSGLEFVPIGMPSHSNSYEQIPSMGSSREYVAGDTVDL